MANSKIADIEAWWPCGHKYCNVMIEFCRKTMTGSSCSPCNEGECNSIPFNTQCTIACKVKPGWMNAEEGNEEWWKNGFFVLLVLFVLVVIIAFIVFLYARCCKKPEREKNHVKEKCDNSKETEILIEPEGDTDPINTEQIDPVANTPFNGSGKNTLTVRSNTTVNDSGNESKSSTTCSSEESSTEGSETSSKNSLSDSFNDSQRTSNLHSNCQPRTNIPPTDDNGAARAEVCPSNASLNEPGYNSHETATKTVKESRTYSD